jgi:hypothetical protein
VVQPTAEASGALLNACEQMPELWETYNARSPIPQRDEPRAGAARHDGEIKPMWGGHRWFCSCGRSGASALNSKAAAERGHLGHVRRQQSAKD